jgi:tetratricopeptide (TPR) repeat protein
VTAPARCPALALGLALALAAGATMPAARHGDQTAAPPPATVRAIVSALERDDVSSAKQAADEALRLFPSDPGLHNLAGVIAAREGSADEAASHFEEAIRLAPKAASPYENLGRLYLEQTSDEPAAADKALDVYDRLLAVQPANAEALYQSAFLLARAGRFQDSRQRLEALPSELKEKPQALAVLAADQLGLGAPDAGEAVTALAGHPQLTPADIAGVLPALDQVKDEDSVRRLLHAVDARGLASPAALYRLGLIDARNQRFEAARAALDRAALAEPSAPLLLDLARVTEKLGAHKEALGYLAHARTLDPSNAYVHFMFGLICIELELHAEAYDSLKRAVELAPDNPDMNYALGAVSMHRHEPAEAIPYFERYLALRPDDVRGRFALGAARFYAKQFEAAREDLEVAAVSPLTTAGARYFLARIARQMNDLTRARAEIDRSLASNPEYPDAWAELGLIQMRAGEYDESEKSLTRALELDADNYAATVNLASLYSRTRDPRRDEVTARLAALQEKREADAQDFLRMIEVVP